MQQLHYAAWMHPHAGTACRPNLTAYMPRPARIPAGEGQEDAWLVAHPAGYAWWFECSTHPPRQFQDTMAGYGHGIVTGCAIRDNAFDACSTQRC